MTYKYLFALRGEKRNLVDLIAANNTTIKNIEREYAKYAYVLHRIITKSIFTADMYKADGCPLNATRINKVLGGRNGKFKAITDNLIAWGFVTKFRGYAPGVYSQGFKLTPAYEAVPKVRELFTEKKHGKMIRNLANAPKEKLKDPIHQALYHVLETYVTVSEEGLQMLREKYNNPYLNQLLGQARGGKIKPDEYFYDYFNDIALEDVDQILMSFLLEGDIYVKQPEVSRRLYHNLCNLKTEYRKYILLRGLPLLETDISNSQVAISVPVVREAIKELYGDQHRSQDLELYQHLAISGTFYEALAREAGEELTAQKRGDFKERFYVQVFFSKPSESNRIIKKAFQRLFPEVYKAISHVKRNDHRKFAIALQNLEADVIVFDVLKQLQDEGHIAIPLHDAIYTNNQEALHRAKELIRNSFKKRYQLDISFKDELTNPAPTSMETIDVNKVIENAKKAIQKPVAEPTAPTESVSTTSLEQCQESPLVSQGVHAIKPVITKDKAFDALLDVLSSNDDFFSLTADQVEIKIRGRIANSALLNEQKKLALNEWVKDFMVEEYPVVRGFFQIQVA